MELFVTPSFIVAQKIDQVLLKYCQQLFVHVGIGRHFKNTVHCPRSEQKDYTQGSLNFVGKLET